VNGLLTPPGVYTSKVPVSPAVNGNCALIWGGETRKSGITEPFKVTHESPSTVGSGVELLGTVFWLRFVPSTLSNPPAVKGWLRSAVFTTPVIRGGAVAAS